ncbi:MAG: hypothetical protein CVU61_03640 [Deltaproteobacteria bacterium HGW-Deltaproteobacteria-19]|jgi:hypothetical protein|nr:MAG: hypothetical protein CVU61_03640 [Deltaproteobacteria bacterium HGW-Deltaproteobacteria-19]
MKRHISTFVLIILLTFFSGTAVPADSTIPDLRGSWTGCSTLKADQTGFAPVPSTFLMEIENQSNRKFSGRLATDDQAPAWKKFRGTLDDRGRFLTVIISDRTVHIGYIISKYRLRLIFYGAPGDGAVTIHVLKKEHPRSAALDTQK